MIVIRSRTVFHFLAVLFAALMLVACGGNGTYSPTTVAGPITPAEITISINPPTDSIYPGGSIQFQAVVTGTNNKAVNWSVVSEDGGTITTGGLYTAPEETETAKPNAKSSGTQQSAVSAIRAASTGLATPKGESASGTFTIQAQSQADPTKTATATATITLADPTVAVTPQNPTMVEGKTLQLSALVTEPNNPSVSQAVTWSISSAGTVSSTGVFTAPYVPGVYQVLARTPDPDGNAGYTDITVVPPSGITVAVNPPTANSLTGGPNIQFTASVSGVPSQAQAVTWSVVLVGSVQYGSISSTGSYTPPANLPTAPQNIQIQATSVADPTKFGTATITVNNG